MALLGNDFTESFSNVQTTDYDPLPEGEYLLRVETADIKDTKDGTGMYIKVMFDVLGPSHQGRKIFTNFNIRNSSSVAESIGKQQLKNLVVAGHVQEPLRDSDQLIGATVRGKVTIRPAENGYEAQNNIKSYRSADSVPDNMPTGGGTFSGAFKGAGSAAEGEFQPWKKGF